MECANTTPDTVLTEGEYRKVLQPHTNAIVDGTAYALPHMERILLAHPKNRNHALLNEMIRVAHEQQAKSRNVLNYPSADAFIGYYGSIKFRADASPSEKLQQFEDAQQQFIQSAFGGDVFAHDACWNALCTDRRMKRVFVHFLVEIVRIPGLGDSLIFQRDDETMRPTVQLGDRFVEASESPSMLLAWSRHQKAWENSSNTKVGSACANHSTLDAKKKAYGQAEDFAKKAEHMVGAGQLSHELDAFVSNSPNTYSEDDLWGIFCRVLRKAGITLREPKELRMLFSQLFGTHTGISKKKHGDRENEQGLIYEKHGLDPKIVNTMGYKYPAGDSQILYFIRFVALLSEFISSHRHDSVLLTHSSALEQLWYMFRLKNQELFSMISEHRGQIKEENGVVVLTRVDADGCISPYAALTGKSKVPDIKPAYKEEGPHPFAKPNELFRAKMIHNQSRILTPQQAIEFISIEAGLDKAKLQTELSLLGDESNQVMMFPCGSAVFYILAATPGNVDRCMHKVQLIRKADGSQDFEVELALPFSAVV